MFHLLFPFFAAALLVEYAIATACFGGLPAAISFLTFLVNACLLVDLINGITLFSVLLILDWRPPIWQVLLQRPLAWLQ